MRKTFETIYILIYCLIGILIALFIYTCISFNNYNKCRAIDFNSKSCEKWRNYWWVIHYLNTKLEQGTD